MAVGRAFADLAAIQVDAGHPGLCGEGDELRFVIGEFAAAEPVLLLGQHDNRAAFGSLVGQRGKLGGVRHFGFADSGRGEKFRSLAIAKGYGAGFVEQQRIHVACGLHGATGHRQHVVLDQTIHTGDADGREQAADRGGNQADQQRNQNEYRLRRAGVNGEGLQRHHGQQEDDGQSGEQDVQSNFIGSLLARSAFHQSDHAIQKGFAGIRSDLDLDLIAENARATGDGRAISAGFTNHRSRLAGDCGFVDGRDTFDDLAIAGDEFSGGNGDQIAGPQLGAGHLFEFAIGSKAIGHGLRAGACARFQPALCRGPRPWPRQSWRTIR